MTQSLSGQLYLDPKDSGDLLMFVCDHDQRPDWVEVTPVGLRRMWPRGRQKVLPLLAAFQAHTLPKLQSAIAAAGGTTQFMRPGDVDRFLAQTKDRDLAQVTACQWLLSFPLLPSDTATLVVAKAGLRDIVCPNCKSNQVAGPDEDGFYDCTACGECFALEGAHV